jgi:hypothetical protein
VQVKAMKDAGYDEMSLSEVTQQARDALSGSSDAVFVSQVPSGLIIAASPAASMLLNPESGDVVGRSLEEFTRDEPSGALALFADGRINGYETERTLVRPGKTDLQLRLLHKRFGHQSASRFALVFITTGQRDIYEIGNVAATPSVPVVGSASGAGVIEQVSCDTVALFGKPASLLRGSPVSALVDSMDCERWRAATSEASTGVDTVTVVVRT